MKNVKLTITALALFSAFSVHAQQVVQQNEPASATQVLPAQNVVPLVDNSWSTTQLVLEGAAITSLYVDYKQTENIVSQHSTHYNSWTESNPVLGKYPSSSKVKTYFITTELLQFTIAKTLPSNYRTWFLSSVVAIEVLEINHNKQIGISWKQ